MKQATEVSLGNLTILVLNTRPDLLFSVKKATKKKKKKKKKKKNKKSNLRKLWKKNVHKNIQIFI